MTLVTYDSRKHAELLADYCLYLQKGERVLVSTNTAALPLLREVNRAILARGGSAAVQLSYPEQEQDLIELADEGLLRRVHPTEVAAAAACDAFLALKAPAPLATSNPELATRGALRNAALSELSEARAGKKWSLTLFPTAAAAAQAEMSMPEFEDYVMRAMFLDQADPVAAWGEIRTRQAALIDDLSRADEIHIQNAGTDLKLSVKGRTWANSDGKRNMPSGEVFTGPIETSANGVVTFSVPTVYGGGWVRGARLEFKDGLVVAASAEEGEEILLAALDTDAGARRLGEIGIGSNFGIQRPIGNILFDEKIGGTVHLAIGRSYPETGGTNESAIHWDLITDLRPQAGGGTVHLDGRLWQENGVWI